MPMGMACGPVQGNFYAEAGFETPEGVRFYVFFADLMGFPHFLKVGESVIDRQVEMEKSRNIDRKFQSKLMDHLIADMESYREIFENEESEWFPVFCYFTYLTHSYKEDRDKFIEGSVGKYLDEIQIPLANIKKEIVEE